VPRWNNSSRVVPAPGFIEPCLPTDAPRVPDGPQWIHEIKHDGYRLLVRKHDGKVRIYTRRGVDWTKRFPRIVEAAMRMRHTSLYLDGEGVVCGKDGIAVFDKLHSKANDEAVFIYAFDVLELNGDDLREAPLEDRKRRLERLLRKSQDGIVFNEHLEGDGAVMFKHACKLRLEGIVSKRRDMRYRSGRSKAWLKIKNPKSPAMLRIEDGTF
jgi:bifunctional non-homologous end joining protein LigD